MASTYTDSNGFEKPGDGEQSGTWGQTVNTNMDLLDEALEGSVTVTLPSAGTSGSPNSFAIADGSTAPARHRYVIFSDGGDLGATAYVQLTPNDASKIYFAKNSLTASRSLVVFQGTYAAGRAVTISAGETYLIAFDGGGATATCTKIGEIPAATGTMVGQDANSVTVTGGTLSGVTITSSAVSATSGTMNNITISSLATDLAVADGGTGASTAANARANLGLAIGSNVQGWDNNLDQIAALTPTNNYLLLGNGSAWIAGAPATVRASLNISPSAANKYLYSTGADTWAEGDITAQGRALLDDSTAAAQRTTLGLTENVVTTTLASQAEAEAGTDNAKLMTPLRTAQAIQELSPGFTFVEPVVPDGAQTAVDFTGIPAGVKEVIIGSVNTYFGGYGLIQLGTSGGLQVANYTSGFGAYFGNATSTNGLGSYNGIYFREYYADRSLSVTAILHRVSPNADRWIAMGTVASTQGMGTFNSHANLAGPLTQVRVTRSGTGALGTAGAIFFGYR